MVATLRITDDTLFQQVLDRTCGVGDADQDPVVGKLDVVRTIVDEVRQRGDAAVAEYTAKFDGVSLRPDQFEVTTEEIDQAVASVDADMIAALNHAHARIQTFHSKHLRTSWEETDETGTVIGQRITPIESAGVYVPGAKAFYPSSVLMNIAPACVAGVREIIMVSPPSYQGSIHPVVLAAAKLAGATRIFRIGGAQAIAALAYGTERIPSVLKITGPGNAYVAAAKRLVSTMCAIDMEAGPSEVVIIADAEADARFVGAEMLAQAEHDEEARSILFTPSEKLAEAVQQALAEQTANLSRKNIIEQALSRQGLIVVVRTMTEAITLTNQIAPEHLSIQTENPQSIFAEIRNAGAVMLGRMTPVAVGDYYAGPNHILPTGRRARFASPLTAEDFRKVTSIMAYTPERLRKDSADIVRLATAEGLTAHANAVEVRL